jgi:hypothetical protein
MKKSILLLLLILLASLLTACASANPLPATPTLPAPTQPESTSPAATPTPQPPTATPAPGKVLLVEPDSAGAAVGAKLKELAAASKFTLQSLASLKASDLTPEVRIVVLLSTPEGLNELMAGAPKVQFVALGLPDLKAGANLSLISAQPEQAAFVAGFIAIIISEDWRSAGLLPDAPAALQDAFLNGGRYYCGRCIPIHGPIVAFPLAAALPAGSSASAWQDPVTRLQTKILETVYVDPTVSSPDLLKLLAKQRLNLVGGLPPTPDLASQWAATVSLDYAAPLAALWPGLVQGKGGQSASAAVQVTDINPALLGIGKQRLMQDVITGLQAGTIGALTIQ